MSKSKEQFKHNLKKVKTLKEIFEKEIATAKKELEERVKQNKENNKKILKQFYRESDPDKKWKLFRSIESEDYSLLNNHLHHPDNY
tara:strand:+ start:286 stop:543 length:258 start_codon:yes stop_codon:yes gene_type:complete